MKNNFNCQQNIASINSYKIKSNIDNNNKVLRNTYLLLSLTVLFSAFTATLSMAMNIQKFNPIVTLIVYLALLFCIQATRDSFIGLITTFSLTGFLGLTLGPILNFYITSLTNGFELIIIALGSTGITFLAMSLIALKSNSNFAQLGSFLWVGSIITFIAIIINLLLGIPALQLAISIIVALISSGFILWQTSQIKNKMESNYIIATVNVYVSLINIFLTFLQFLGIFSNNRD